MTFVQNALYLLEYTSSYLNIYYCGHSNYFLDSTVNLALLHTGSFNADTLCTTDDMQLGPAIGRICTSKVSTELIKVF